MIFCLLFLRKSSNESTAGADTSMEALKLLDLASYVHAVFATTKSGEMIDHDLC